MQVQRENSAKVQMIFLVDDRGQEILFMHKSVKAVTDLTNHFEKTTTTLERSYDFQTRF